MKNKIIIYLADDNIHCFMKKENRFITYNLLPKTIQYGKIIHRPKFQKQLSTFLKKQKIIKRFRRNIIYFITPPTFEEVDKEIIQLIFDELPIDEIKFIKEKNLYQLSKNTLWINIHSNYAYFTYLQKNEKITLTWNKKINFSLEEFIKRLLKNEQSIKKIILIGSNKNIPLMAKEYENLFEKRILYYENYDKYLLNQTNWHNFP
ncbi:MAG: hypothetical protein HFI09_00430 [Bacilli bacterium]|nr:hypothetical protein [Bacilli bacterium]